MQTATTSTPSDSAASRTSDRSRRNALPWPTVLAAICMLYTFVVAGALLGAAVPADRAWILMAIPCLVPMAWCAAGFFQGLSNSRDAGEAEAGLILSAVGWLLVFAGLVLKHFAIIAAQPDAYASQATLPAIPLCIGLGVLCLLIGAVLSWIAWSRDEA